MSEQEGTVEMEVAPDVWLLEVGVIDESGSKRAITTFKGTEEEIDKITDDAMWNRNISGKNYQGEIFTIRNGIVNYWKKYENKPVSYTSRRHAF